MDYRLRPMRETDLGMVLEWRNQPVVRKKMFNAGVISEAEHYAWYQRIKDDPQRRYLIYEEDQIPLGQVNFIDISEHHHTATIGFYSADQHRQEVGLRMMQLLLEHAFLLLGLRKLWAEVLASNGQVLMFARSCGFELEGILRGQVEIDARPVDVHRLGMLRSEWQAHHRAAIAQRVSGEIDQSTCVPAARHKEIFHLTAEDLRSLTTWTAVADSDDSRQRQARASFSEGDGEMAAALIATTLARRYLAKDFGMQTRCLAQSLNFTAPIQPNRDHVLRLRVTSRAGRRLQLAVKLTDVDGRPILSSEMTLWIEQQGRVS